jgi:hemerythrin-like domain-containing protein
MIVVELFEKEHALFRVLVERLELDLSQSEDRARADMSDALRALLPALDRHAEIEDIVFLHPPDSGGDDAKALAEVAAQHQKLAGLRDEILLALEQSSDAYPLERLRRLTETLIKDLRVHLETEEIRLWPLYQGALGRPLDAVVPIHLERRAQALENELRRAIAAISHSSSLDGPKPRGQPV